MFLTNVLKVIKAVNGLKGEVIINRLTYVNRFSSSVVFVILSTVPAMQQISNNLIECDNNKSYKGAINSFCLIEGIFTLSSANKEDVKTHLYYIWVPFVMFFCALLAHVGHLMYSYVLWGNYLNNFVKAIRTIMENKTTLEKHQFQKLLNDSFSKERVTYESSYWVISYSVMMVFNFFTPLVQFFFLNILLKGDFLMLGFIVFNKYEQDKLFPKIAKCTFKRFGPSGTLENIDSLCVLSLNIINEKIFLIAWYWLLLMFLLQIFEVFNCLFELLCLKKTSFLALFCHHNGILNDEKLKKFHLSMISKLSFCSSIYCSYVFKNMNLQFYKVLLENLCNDLYECPDEVVPLLSQTEGNLNQDLDKIGIYFHVNGNTCSLLYVSHNESLFRIQKLFSGFVIVKKHKFTESVSLSEPLHYNFISNGSLSEDFLIEVRKKSKISIYVYKNNNSCDIHPLEPEENFKLYCEFSCCCWFVGQRTVKIDLLPFVRSLRQKSDKCFHVKILFCCENCFREGNYELFDAIILADSVRSKHTFIDESDEFFDATSQHSSVRFFRDERDEFFDTASLHSSVRFFRDERDEFFDAASLHRSLRSLREENDDFFDTASLLSSVTSPREDSNDISDAVSLLSSARAPSDESDEICEVPTLVSDYNANFIQYSIMDDSESDSNSQSELLAEDLTAIIHTTDDGLTRVNKIVPVLIR